jgi:histidine triad (HIT) family protein
VNIFLADGEAAGQEVFHVHLHIFPRFAGDGFGLKFANSYFQMPSREELDEAARRIRAALDGTA